MNFTSKEKELYEELKKIIEKSSEPKHEISNNTIDHDPVLKYMLDNNMLDDLLPSTECLLKLENISLDGKEIFEIMMNFFKKLISENHYGLIKTELPNNNSCINKKEIVLQYNLERLQECKNESNVDKKTIMICQLYLFFYETTCTSFFKLFAKAITGKSNDRCGCCMEKICKFEPNMKLVLKPFIADIRNSIGHENYYYDQNKKIIIFCNNKSENAEDYNKNKGINVFYNKNKPKNKDNYDKNKPRHESLEQLITYVRDLINYSGIMHFANLTIDLLLDKYTPYITEIKNNCKILNIEYEKIIKNISSENNILELGNMLKLLVDEENNKT